MLEAVPTNFLSYAFLLHDNGTLVGELDSSVLREAARLELEEGTYSLYREGLFSGDFILDRDGKAVARATKTNIWRSNFDVMLPGRTVKLERLSIWQRRFAVFEGDQQVGSIYPVGIFTRRANIELPSAWPMAHRVFLFWLAFLMWKRQNQAAAS